MPLPYKSKLTRQPTSLETKSEDYKIKNYIPEKDFEEVLKIKNDLGLKT